MPHWLHQPASTRGSLLRKPAAFINTLKWWQERQSQRKALPQTELLWFDERVLRVRGLPDRKTSLAGLVWEKTSDRMPADSLTSPMCVITPSACPAKHLYKRDICALHKNSCWPLLSFIVQIQWKVTSDKGVKRQEYPSLSCQPESSFTCRYDLKYVILAMLQYSAVSKQCFWTSLFWPWKGVRKYSTQVKVPLH